MILASSLLHPLSPSARNAMDQLPSLDNTYVVHSSSRFVSPISLAFPRFGALFIGAILGAVWVVSPNSLFPALISMSFVQAIWR